MILPKGQKNTSGIVATLNNFGQLTSSGFFKSFDMKICSMLLYGCEVWGTTQFENIERIHYYACKRLMNVSQRASNYAVLGDCGRNPLYIDS